MVSCSEDYSSPLKGQAVSNKTFETGTNSMTITIGREDLSKCIATSSENWCSVLIQGSSVIVSVLPNNTYEERQATVTLTDPEDATTLSFQIIQNQNDAILVDGSTFEIAEEGGDVNIKVQSNVNYVVDIPFNVNWLTLKSTSTRTLSDSVIGFTASKNESGDEREATVKLIDSDSGTSSEFTIKQGLTPIVTLDNDDFLIDEYGGEIEVSINANIDLITDCKEDWVEVNNRTETNGFNFVQKIKIGAFSNNDSENNRTAEVYFTDKIGKWNLKKSIAIKQIKSLSFQDTNVEIYLGESYSLNLLNNTDGAVIWESSNTSIATVNSSGEVTGVSKGSVSIMVTSEDGEHSAQITIMIKEILDDISCSFANGWGTESTSSGGSWTGFKLWCTLKNNSSRSIVLKKCLVYQGNTYLDAQTFNNELIAGASKTVTLKSVFPFNGRYTFLWEFSFNGKDYTYLSNYNN